MKALANRRDIFTTYKTNYFFVLRCKTVIVALVATRTLIYNLQINRRGLGENRKGNTSIAPLRIKKTLIKVIPFMLSIKY